LRTCSRKPYIDILAGGPATLAGIEAALGFENGTFFSDDTSVLESFTHDDEAYSLFGSADFHVTDRLTATLGLNYTKDKKQVSITGNNSDVFGNLDFQGADGIRVVSGGIFVNGQGAIPGVLPNGIPSFFDAFGLAPTPENIGLIASGGAGAGAQAAFGAYNAGVTQFATAVVSNPATNPLAGLFGLQFQPQQLVFPNSVEDGRTNDDELTYTARLAYEVNDNFNVYGSYATGFKASSWNLTRDTRPFLANAAALQADGLLPNNYIPATGRNFGTRGFAVDKGYRV